MDEYAENSISHVIIRPLSKQLNGYSFSFHQLCGEVVLFFYFNILKALILFFLNFFYRDHNLHFHYVTVQLELQQTKYFKPYGFSHEHSPSE